MGRVGVQLELVLDLWVKRRLATLGSHQNGAETHMALLVDFGRDALIHVARQIADATIVERQTLEVLA